jgi:hypothetical protein
VKLTVKGYYGCETASVTKTIHVYLTPPVGGEWVPISKAKLLTAWISLASTTIALTGLFIYIRRKKKQE